MYRLYTKEEMQLLCLSLTALLVAAASLPLNTQEVSDPIFLTTKYLVPFLAPQYTIYYITLPKAQRTRGLSSAYQSNLF